MRLLVDGKFSIGEDDYLAEAICKGANVNCDDKMMWAILYDAMDYKTDPKTVIGRLAL